MRKNLQTARQKQNFTQKQLADILGITVWQYQKIENGGSDGSVKVWVKLSKLFKKSINYLLADYQKTE